jgi:hypothetical protein
MSDIKSLLTNNMNPQARLMTETRGLQQKWDKTGLLEGLQGVDKANMSILLENQAKQLLDEATATGTSANSEQWAGVALPLVRRVFAEISAKEFVSVQPMNLPSGLIFYLDFKYGTNIPTAANNDYSGSLFGGNYTNSKLGSTDDAVNGLYGAGRYGYTSKPSSLWFPAAAVATASANDVNWDSNFTSSTKTFSGQTFTVDLTSNPLSASVDLNAVRSFVLTGSSVSAGNLLNEFTKVINTGTYATPNYKIVFVFTGSTSAATMASTVFYDKQPTDSTRGDFEDTFTTAGAGSSGLSADIGIPEVNLELKSEPIVAKTRKLKAVWTPELAQDLNAYHSIDAEAELTALLSEYVSMEIDLEILDMLINAAPGVTTEAWSVAIGTEFVNKTVNSNGSVTFGRTTDTANRTAYVKSTWFQTLGNKIQKVSNKIHQLTLRGGANFLVCGPDVATILESIPGYVVNTDGDSAKFAMGVSRVGSFASRFQVYKNPYMQENTILVGFRGNNFLETGAVYAPYIPLVQTPLVYDPVNFTPRRGVMTRYAKKVVRPEFYGKILVADLDQV